MKRCATVLIVVLAGLVVAGEVSAEPGTPEHVAPGLVPAPVSAVDAPDVVPAVAERLFQLGAGRGFVSQRTDHEARAISLVWKGDVPEDVLAHATSRPHGVSITITTGARYAREEGDAARGRILRDPIAREIGIVSASVNQDGSGLTLGVTSQRVTEEQRDHLARLAGLGREEITINGGRVAHEGYASRQINTKA